MHGEHKRSIPQKVLLGGSHFVAVVFTAWLLFGNGLEITAKEAGLTLQTDNIERRALLLMCSLIYFVRVSCMTGYFLRRSIDWSEAVTVAGFLWLLHVGFALLGGTNTQSPGWIAVLGLSLYVLGSYLNTASEFQRHEWKQRPANQGHIYTEGLFRYSMHINYFGDVVLFAGFALVTGRAWALLVPVVMAGAFYWMHIPILDRYLRERYGAEFESYLARTPRFFPCSR